MPPPPTRRAKFLWKRRATMRAGYSVLRCCAAVVKSSNSRVLCPQWKAPVAWTLTARALCSRAQSADDAVAAATAALSASEDSDDDDSIGDPRQSYVRSMAESGAGALGMGLVGSDPNTAEASAADGGDSSGHDALGMVMSNSSASQAVDTAKGSASGASMDKELFIQQVQQSRRAVANSRASHMVLRYR